MAHQYSIAVRNSQLDAVVAAVGASAILRLRTGPVPASCTSPDAGVALVAIALPATWMLPAANGVAEKTGTWEDPSAEASGTVGHYRLYAADGATCHEQGSVTATGGGGDLELDEVEIAVGQAVSIVSFARTAGNA